LTTASGGAICSLTRSEKRGSVVWQRTLVPVSSVPAGALQLADVEAGEDEVEELADGDSSGLGEPA
jgi:hypothetical protein